MVTSDYLVTATLVFPEPGENYTERFIMNGESQESVRKRVRLMLADDRYLVAVRSA